MDYVSSLQGDLVYISNSTVAFEIIISKYYMAYIRYIFFNSESCIVVYNLAYIRYNQFKFRKKKELDLNESNRFLFFIADII